MAAVRLALVAAALCAVCAADTMPQQVHIALAGDDGKGNSNGMAVSWVTVDNTATSTVRYGTSSGVYTMQATGTSSSYLVTYDHHVVLSNLQPLTRYFYVCGDATGGWSQEYSFMSAPVSAPDASFTVAIWGDFGVGQTGNAIASHEFLMNTIGETDFYYHVGDISYADDAFLHYPLKFKYEDIFNDYMVSVSNFTSRYPYMVLPGNHESECHSPACLLDEKRSEALRNFTAYNHRFRLPFRESGAPCNMWYSFNYGNVHFVSFNTETDWAGAPEEKHGDSGLLPAGGFAPAGELMRWLEADLALANANRAVRPWIIVTGHRPIYNTNSMVQKQRDNLEDLLQRYHVDLYVTGHQHSYTRTWPVYNNTVTARNYINPAAAVHLVVGGAGCDEMKHGVSEAVDAANVGHYVAAENSFYSIGRLTVSNATHLHFDLFSSENHTVIDAFTLIKKY